MAEIIIGDFHKGIGLSKYDAERFDDMQNVDIVTEVGTARCNFGLVKDSGNTITERVIPCPVRSGNIYFFSADSGKIWVRSTGGSYSSLTANPNGAHYDAKFYDNWVYYATATELGRFADGGTSRTDSKDSFSGSGFDQHPMEVMNKLLFIGDGKRLARVNDSGDFTGDAVKLQSQEYITLLKPYGYDILLFSSAGSKVISSGVYRYDTASSAWSSEDHIETAESNIAINSNDTDEVYLVAGGSGDIYSYNGVRLQYINTVRGIVQGTHNRLNTTFNRKPLFASGGIVYGLIKSVSGMAYPALTKEYVCSGGEDSTIHAIQGTADTLLVTWKNGSTYGVDKIDTNYATATIDSPLILKGKISQIEVYYESLPENCSIDIAFKNDNDVDWTEKTMDDDEVLNDTIKKKVYLKAGPGNKRSLQARITLNPYNTGTPVTPVIQYIKIITE